ncbi:hypothetical protein IPN41_00580 [Candidatus Falkowbacteria bacterium]|nr:MAG: hypothetical protein IPN41_00580 [Candidatus Falkowbacteria bacterium]
MAKRKSEKIVLKEGNIIVIKKFDNHTNKEFYDKGEGPDKAKILDLIEENGKYKEIAVEIIGGKMSARKIEFTYFGSNTWRLLFEDPHSLKRVYSINAPYYRMEILNDEKLIPYEDDLFTAEELADLISRDAFG